MKYKFKYRKGLFWKTKTVVGHILQKDMNRMDLYLEGGAIFSIANWDKYDFRLGIDWVLATKEQLEREAGKEIKLGV
jgi:hypothetical protein